SYNFIYCFLLIEFPPALLPQQRDCLPKQGFAAQKISAQHTTFGKLPALPLLSPFAYRSVHAHRSLYRLSHPQIQDFQPLPSSQRSSLEVQARNGSACPAPPPSSISYVEQKQSGVHPLL